ncbi:MAG: (d)CMP kinase [Holosporaceae bacterium]|jgi:cytidylate kinase|nr:(d)CMP kinase [Holosporaceae bacterium]
MKPKVITIDGPACSGKGTIARRLADRLEFAYLDTGMLYRIVAYADTDPGNFAVFSARDVLSIADSAPEGILRSDAVGRKASEIAVLPQVREIITKLQRDFIAHPGDGYAGSVLDGRDTGTAVAPDADCKIFVTADLEVRAKRRFDFLKETNPNLTFEEILQSLTLRDEQDQSRAIAPMICDDNYVILDTSLDSPEESVAKAFEIVRRKLDRPLENECSD